MKPRALGLLVMHVSARCDQTCAHCSIWKRSGRAASSLGVVERLDIIHEARSLGATSILFTGGEPLLCDHLEVLAREAQSLGLSVQIATNGIGLARARGWLGESVAEVYLSLEGPEAVHDAIRGASMFSRLRDSVEDVLGWPRRPVLIGRSVISARNAATLDLTAAAARSLGLDGVSFLPVDVTSEAFGGDPAARRNLRPHASEVAAMRRAIERLDAAFELGVFVREDAARLNEMADAFLPEVPVGTAPACNAPEWSSVVEADGAVRPCFFQPPLGHLDSGATLASIRASENYREALRQLGPGNRICGSCVCPKYLARGIAAWPGRVSRALRGEGRSALQRTSVSA